MVLRTPVPRHIGCKMPPQGLEGVQDLAWGWAEAQRVLFQHQKHWGNTWLCQAGTPQHVIISGAGRYEAGASRPPTPHTFQQCLPCAYTPPHPHLSHSGWGVHHISTHIHIRPCLMHVYMHIHIHTPIFMQYTLIHRHVYTAITAHTYPHICPTHTHIYAHISTHTCIPCIHAHKYTDSHTHEIRA